jgi:putative ABC transport system substrate-binding protein
MTIRRRDFITLLGFAAAWPLAARAQRAMPVIGFLNGASAQGYAAQVAAFRQALREAGFVEGRDFALEYRFAEGQYDRLPALAADLIRRQVAVIVANSAAALAAKAATSTIPIIFTSPADPVASGLVASLSRPGGNVTGITTLAVEVEQKRVELLHELVPAVGRIGALINPGSPNAEIEASDMRDAARALGLEMLVLRAHGEGDFNAAFDALLQFGAGGLVIGADPFFNSSSGKLAALALRHVLPSIYQFRDFAAAGGLMSYGGSELTEPYHLAGLYAGRILKGEKPADLPVQRATKVELIVNLKTANALGVTVPITLLGRADEVIE